MFISKSELSHIRDELKRIEGSYNDHIAVVPIACEKCGCVVASPIKGEGVIKQKPITFLGRMTSIHSEMVDYVYYPHYCITHAPKAKKP